MSRDFPQITLPGTEVRVLSSKHVEQDFRLFIYLPYEYESSEQTYPVVYALDGNMNFYRDIWSLQTAPPMIVVGIGYDTDEYSEHMRLRWRDYFSTHDSENTTTKGFEEWFQIEIVGGGAEAFMRFIREELFPFIDGEYRTTKNDRTIMGHSAGGAFGLYALFKSTDTFNRYIIIAPALNWDNEVSFAYEQEFAEQNTDLSAKLYIGVGDLDETLDSPLYSSAVRLHSVLKSRNYESLAMELDVIQDVGHAVVRFPAVRRGILSVFDAPPG